MCRLYGILISKFSKREIIVFGNYFNWNFIINDIQNFVLK